jgi:hypothetical protein
MEPADDEDLEVRRRLAELVSAEAGAVSGALVGLLIGGPPGALLGAGAGAVVQHVTKEAMARRFGRATEAVEIAANEAGLTAEELLQQILADESLLELAARVVAAAAETTSHAKIRAVGKALGRGVRDDAMIDQERFIVNSLAGLDVPHFRVLEQIYDDYEGYGSPRRSDGTPGAYGWTNEALAQHLPGLAPVLTPLLGVLNSRGLIVNTAVGTLDSRPGVTDRWILTEYGRDVVHWLEHSQEQDDAAPDASAQDPSEG